jgi:hypothetical protein
MPHPDNIGCVCLAGSTLLELGETSATEAENLTCRPTGEQELLLIVTAFPT